VADKTGGGGVFGSGNDADTTTSATATGQTLSASAGIVVYDTSKNGKGAATGPVTSTTTWTPPACYYAPLHTPDEMEKTMEEAWRSTAPSQEWILSSQDYYKNGHPYTDFNKDKSGKGFWWSSYVTPGRESDPAADDCDEEHDFWVDKGDAPPADKPQAITPKVLAELAYGEIRVPSTKVTLAPAGTTKVNLPTWAWLDAADFKPVSVTASLPALGISATTTAEPVSVRIEPGTSDAVTYPDSGVCALSGDRIGEPYAKDKSDGTPPCGVKYLRSSGDGPFQLKATVTWKISWASTDNPGGPFPDGTFGATQDVVVQEIEAVNR
jgi:enoyl reductase